MEWENGRIGSLIEKTTLSKRDREKERYKKKRERETEHESERVGVKERSKGILNKKTGRKAKYLA